MLLSLRSAWEQITAVGSITEAADSLVATAGVLVSASSAITEAADSVAATATALVSASASITEAADSVAATATVSDSASEASTEADDTLAATVTTSISATASITEADDVLTATLSVPSTGTGCFILLANGSSKLLEASGVDHLLLFDCVVTPASTEDPLGDYSLIPLYRRRKKKLEEELEEIALRLRDIAIDIPLPGHSAPVIYNRPLISPFIEQKQQQTLNALMARAKIEAEYQARLKREQDDDDEAAILLLWP